MSTPLLRTYWHGEPSTTKNSSSSRVPKTGTQLQTTWRSAKNGLNKTENTFILSPPAPDKRASHRRRVAVVVVVVLVVLVVSDAD